MKMRTYWENERRKLLGQPLIQDTDNQENTAIDAPLGAVLRQGEEEYGMKGKYHIYAYDLSGILRFKIATQGENEIYLLPAKVADTQILYLHSRLGGSAMVYDNGCWVVNRYGLSNEEMADLITNLENQKACSVGDVFLKEAEPLAKKSNDNKMEYGFLLYFEYDKVLKIQAIENYINSPAAPLFNMNGYQVDDLVSYIEAEDKKLSFLKKHIIGFGHTHPHTTVLLKVPASKAYIPRRNRPTTNTMTNEPVDLSPMRKIRDYENPNMKGGYIACILTEHGFMFYPTLGTKTRYEQSFISVQNRYIHVFDYNKNLIYEGISRQD